MPSHHFISGAHDGRSGLRRHHGRDLRAGGPHRPGGGEAVNVENIVGLLVAAALLGYLVLALVKPERF
ncbi:potassium-transporting ATPase subunit F [Streptomyces sp. fd1-xmd]|nr:potassium-transporting ATPase subunit F [Streptomyces sp. fd1-xmd]